MLIRTCSMEDISEIVTLAYEKNQYPESNSAFCCKTQDSILEDFRYILNSDEHKIVGAYKFNQLYGFCAFFMNATQNTVDCVGPFINDEDYILVSKTIVYYAKSLFPKNAHYNFCFDKRNADCLKLMNEINAVDMGNECTLVLKKENYKPLNIELLTDDLLFEQLSEHRYTEFLKLFDEIFPEIYVSGEEVLYGTREKRIVYTLNYKDEIIAFGILNLHNNINNNVASAEIIGVAKSYRGKGYGRVLLNRLVQEAFLISNIERINLVVDNINTNARNLYFSTGFELCVENCSFRFN